MSLFLFVHKEQKNWYKAKTRVWMLVLFLSFDVLQIPYSLCSVGFPSSGNCMMLIMSDVDECKAPHHGTGQAGWDLVRWLTELAAESPTPGLPSNVLHANCPRCRRLLCESPPGEQTEERGNMWISVCSWDRSDSASNLNIQMRSKCTWATTTQDHKE